MKHEELLEQMKDAVTGQGTATEVEDLGARTREAAYAAFVDGQLTRDQVRGINAQTYNLQKLLYGWDA